MGDKINNRVMIEDERIVAPDPLSETVELVQMTPEELFDFNSQARSLLLNAINKNGIFASEDPRFHHRFGRDTFITAYFIAESIKYSPQEELWQRTKKAVFNFWEHQLPNGQAPHEIKPFNKRDATKRFYYRNGDNLVNDDSVDATPLALIVTPMFIETEEELEQFIPKANKALDWMIQNIETYSGWLSYKYNRKNGGLVNQGWMDSKDSIKWRSIRFPPDPIALVEVQAYAWKALRVWSDIFAQRDPNLTDPEFDDLYEIGTIATITQMMSTEGEIHAMVHGQARIRLKDIISFEPYLIGQVEEISEDPANTDEVQALARQLTELFKRSINLGKSVDITTVMKIVSGQAEPVELVDSVAYLLEIKPKEKQNFLAYIFFVNKGYFNLRNIKIYSPQYPFYFSN